nr:SusC/RagA family TonB-linked outer membrane protein [Bacteroides intestinalis]
MKKNKILILAFLLGCSLKGFAQDASHNISGRVIDRWGNPVSGALITVTNNPNVFVSTDRDGKFIISADENNQLEISAPDQSTKTVDVTAGKSMNIVLSYADQATHVGYEHQQTIGESTSSIAIAANQEFNNRSQRNISKSLFGNVLGLTALQETGEYWEGNPTFYLRGLQSISGSTPVIMVDGIERDIQHLTADEVESVVVLKDAAAVALYGYKGINGVVNVVTKRGKYNSREVNFTYDHAINWDVRRPKFVDAHTYASAMNEALGHEGSQPMYSQKELAAFQSGQYPYYYPNVDWMDETFKNTGATNIYNIDFCGGGQKFRYYTAVNLQINKGFVKTANANEGYSTQQKYSKANLRTNLDIDLSAKTKLVANLFGSLSESSRPGGQDPNDSKKALNLWDLVYSLPSAALPIKLDNGMWAGNSTWLGTMNPVAQSQGAAYTKGHVRALYADMTLRQDLSAILPGLGGSFQLAYDDVSNIIEDHSKSYRYNAYSVQMGEDGVPVATLNTPQGEDSPMGSSKSNTFTRNFNFYGSLFYNQVFNEHSLYSQLKWNYEYRNYQGKGHSLYRQHLSFYTHYGYKNRYFADFSIVGAASNRLAPGKKWAASPVVSAAWVLSKENFMKNISFVDFLKLRASFGIISTDNIPGDGYWLQTYNSSGSYSFGDTYSKLDAGGWTMGQLASLNSTHEKAYKYNLGLDATLFGNFDLTFDAYYQRRKDIWVDGKGKYSSILGFEAPFENGGVVDSWGTELGLNYHKQVGDVRLMAGVNFTLTKNKIIEELEEPRPYSYLEETGNPLKQLRGLVAEGLFKDQAEIDKSPTQSYGAVYPGDIKYKDMNGDNVIDDNDMVAIGYSSTLPEIYYSFHLGAEWKGLGFDAMFQGTGRYSGMLDTKAMYRPLLSSTSLSQYHYDNRWTLESPDALFPRLASQNSENNYRNSTWWLRDRSFLKLRNVEVYYHLPKSLLQNTKIVKNAKLYVRGIDLLCFDHINEMDPETYGSTTPTTRSVVFGLVVGF